VSELAAQDRLAHIPHGAGEPFDVAGARLTWKVKAEDSEGRFCFFEQVLAPGDIVPLHLHHYTEAFYILAGSVTFFKGPGFQEAFHSTVGDVVVARAAGLHGFANQGDQEARLLSISVPEHQRFFDALVAADRAHPFAAMPREAAMQRVAEIGGQTDSIFVQP
jgi:mannose-6-phosphate isomerase-like protein (cupin superfamily)